VKPCHLPVAHARSKRQASPCPACCVRAAHFEPLLADMELLAGPALCAAAPHLQVAGGPTLGEQQAEQLLGFLAAQGKPRLLQCLLSALQSGRAGGGAEADGQSAAGEGQLQERPSWASTMSPVTAVPDGVLGELSGWQAPATPAAGPAPRPPAWLGGDGVQGPERAPTVLAAPLAGPRARDAPAGSEGRGGSLEGALSLFAAPGEGEGAAGHVRTPSAAVARPPSLALEPAAAAQPSCSGMAAPPASSTAWAGAAEVAAGSLGAPPAAARAHPGRQLARWAPGPRTNPRSSPIGQCAAALAIAPAAPPRCPPPHATLLPLPTSRCRRLRDTCLGSSSPHEEAAYVAAKSGWLVGFDLQASPGVGKGSMGSIPGRLAKACPVLSRALLVPPPQPWCGTYV
jgi:hypothetical protein